MINNKKIKNILIKRLFISNKVLYLQHNQNRKEMKTKELPTDYEQIVKVSDLKGLGRRIADISIKEYGFYTCILSSVKTLVIPDNEWM